MRDTVPITCNLSVNILTAVVNRKIFLIEKVEFMRIYSIVNSLKSL